MLLRLRVAVRQVVAVEPTQELEQCRRCLVATLDALLTRLRAARVRVNAVCCTSNCTSALPPVTCER